MNCFHYDTDYERVLGLPLGLLLVGHAWWYPKEMHAGDLSWLLSMWRSSASSPSFFPFSKAAPCHPAEENHFNHLYLRSHDPKLTTIGKCWNVDGPVNQDSISFATWREQTPFLWSRATSSDFEVPVLIHSASAANRAQCTSRVPKEPTRQHHLQRAEVKSCGPQTSTPAGLRARNS